MKIKKKVKKAISFIVPKGYNKEVIKLYYYRLFASKNTSFGIEKRHNITIFKTVYKGATIYTNQSLYPTSDDFSNYQHYYSVKSGDVVIDAGANMGHISLFFAKNVGANGKVYCFEPDKFNIQSLKENLQLNKDLPNNVVIEDLLLWNENTLIDFEEAGTVGSSAVWFSDNANVVKKQAVTVDSWVKEKQLPRLDMIKMDIEGAEIEALDGCVAIIKEFQPNFAIASYHIVNGEPTYIKVEEFFNKMNYPYKTITFRGNEIITFAGLKVK